MAGGGKETPRQKMIGMMYLVLTALLALQVSNAVLDKFIFIDQSLRHSVSLTMDANNKVIEGIKATVEKNGNRARDLEVVKKSEQVRDLTHNVIAELDEVRSKIVEVSGGMTEDGKFAGAKDYDKQMAYTLGPEGQKSGVAYKLKNTLNNYVQELNALHDSLDLPPLALDAKDIKEFKNDPDQKDKDWAYLNFDHTPTVACMAVLSQMKSEVAQAEAKALELLASSVGADQLKFDKIVAVVKPRSAVIAAGTKYEAEMFLAASSSSAKPKMTFNGNPITVEDGKGLIDFTATGGTYDAQGNLKKTWKGTISIPTPFGDTTFEIEEEYTVAKPVVSVQAAAVSALYFNCGNELNVQVPALGIEYDPSFAAQGAKTVVGAQKGMVTVIPNQPKVALTVKSGGNVIDVIKLSVKQVPKPDLKIFSSNKPVNLKNGFSAPGPRSLELRAIADADFKSFLPKDARYRVTGYELTLARGKRAIGTKKVKAGKVNITDLAQKAKAGDRYVIEVKQVKRMNFQGDTENVRGVSSEIFTIPIN